MKKLMFYLMVFILFFFTTVGFQFLFANGAFDTGLVTFEQPNQVTFTARWWSDGFLWWMETEDGYRFVQNFSDGYYYYAILDENGEFAPSENKVGIDAPLAQSYQLKRSAARQAEIDDVPTVVY